MSRAVLLGCLPWLGWLLASFGCVWLLIHGSRARFDWARLRRLHEDQAGTAQTLSFVLTLPLFVWVVMFIVQVSQLMIAQVVVEYAAYATARAAAVWIPARVDATLEPANCISSYQIDSSPEYAAKQVYPLYGEPSAGGLHYKVNPGSAKYNKIASAAVMAVLPICPSRNVGAAMPSGGGASAGLVNAVYTAMVPGAGNDAATAARLQNKLAYAFQNTAVDIRFFHSNREPPLDISYWPPPPNNDPSYYAKICPFWPNEIGWQDTITVTVTHQLGLLPGPGSLLYRWRKATAPGSTDTGGTEKIQQASSVYTYPLVASATLGNEGDVPVIPYEYHPY